MDTSKSRQKATYSVILNTIQIPLKNPSVFKRLTLLKLISHGTIYILKYMLLSLNTERR